MCDGNFIIGTIHQILLGRMILEGLHNTHEREEKRVKNLVGVSEWKKSLGRPGNRWKDNIKVNLKDLKLWAGVGSG